MKYLSLISVILFAAICFFITKDWSAVIGYIVASFWALISFLNELEKEDKQNSITDNNKNF